MNEGLVFLLFISIVFLSIAWIAVPFLIMGVSNRLDKVIKILSDESDIDQKTVEPREEEIKGDPETTESESGGISGAALLLIMFCILALFALIGLLISYN